MEVEREREVSELSRHISLLPKDGSKRTPHFSRALLGGPNRFWGLFLETFRTLLDSKLFYEFITDLFLRH